MEIFLPAFIVPDMPENGVRAFHDHGTVLATFNELAALPLKDYLPYRVGWQQPPVMPRGRKLKNSENGIVDLVITDNVQELYGLLPLDLVKTTLRLGEISQAAFSVLGRELESWEEYGSLSAPERASVITGPLMHFAQRQRKSPSTLFGYTLITWEDFAKTYTAIVSEKHVTILPNQVHSTLTFYDFPGGKVPQVSLCVNEEDGNRRYWLIDRFPNGELRDHGFFTDGQLDQLQTFIYRASHHVSSLLLGFEAPLFRLGDQGAMTAGVKLATYLPEQKFDLPELLKLAAELDISGYSTRSKAELSILIGERLAKEALTAPGCLITTNLQSAGIPERIEPVDADHPIVQQGRERTIKDYYTFATRVIGGAAFAPVIPGSPAGRIPTDGGFPAYYGIEPLALLQALPAPEQESPMVPSAMTLHANGAVSTLPALDTLQVTGEQEPVAEEHEPGQDEEDDQDDHEDCSSCGAASDDEHDSDCTYYA